jgi:uncharacterized protein
MTSCWIMTEGLKGTENQCLALAEAAGLQTEIKVIQLKQPWKSLTPFLPCLSRAAFRPESSALTAPWPDVIIASGRKAIAPALWVKKQAARKTKLVIVQSPVIKNKYFDLVIVPRHDRYRAKNTLEVTGALSLVTTEKLAAAKESWASTLGMLPQPRVAVLVGGNSRAHDMTVTVIERLAVQLRQLVAQNHGLMITVSRRTPQKYIDLLRQTVQGPNVHFWDGKGANPYVGYLAWAEAILVTEDSVSMASEAISTGKPVYIIPMEGGSLRFKRFHDHVIDQGYARWFQGIIEHWTYAPPQDLDQAGQRLRALLSQETA